MSTEQEVDFLTEDPEISGQKYVLLSFLSPEKVLANKDQYFFSKFLEEYEIVFKTKTLETFLVSMARGINKHLEDEADKLDVADLGDAATKCRNSRVKIQDVLADYQEYLKKNQKEVSTSSIKTSWDDFIFKNEQKLEDEFYAINKFHTSMRGLKVRGTYSSPEEASMRAKKLQRIDDKKHDILMAEVGKWTPWDPEPSRIKSQEHANEQLNTLMSEYHKNEDRKETLFNENPELRKKGRGVFGAGVGKEQEKGEPLNYTVAPPSGLGDLPIQVEQSSNSHREAIQVENVITGAAVEESVSGGLFSDSGPADLAIARRMEREAAATKK